MLCLQAKLQSFIIFSLKIDIFSMKSFCLILLSYHSSLHKLEALSPYTTRPKLSSIKSGSSNCPGTLLASETTPSLSSADELNASSGIRDLNCDLNGLNTAKVIRDTNSKPRNSEIYIEIVVFAKVKSIIIDIASVKTIIAPLAPTIAVGLTFLSSWNNLNWSQNIFLP
jgi:hypothetical protein